MIGWSYPDGAGSPFLSCATGRHWRLHPCYRRVSCLCRNWRCRLRIAVVATTGCCSRRRSAGCDATRCEGEAWERPRRMRLRGLPWSARGESTEVGAVREEWCWRHWSWPGRRESGGLGGWWARWRTRHSRWVDARVCGMRPGTRLRAIAAHNTGPVHAGAAAAADRTCLIGRDRSTAGRRPTTFSCWRGVGLRGAPWVGARSGPVVLLGAVKCGQAPEGVCGFAGRRAARNR